MRLLSLANARIEATQRASQQQCYQKVECTLRKHPLIVTRDCDTGRAGQSVPTCRDALQGVE